MKTLLLLTVLLSSVLAVTAAAVESAPQELHVDNQLVEDVIGVPEEGEPEMFPAGERASSSGGRFFTCPSGWVRYKNSCYLYVSSSRTWSSAAAHCASLGASLASVHDVFDYSFLQELTRGSGSSVSWVGGFYFQGWRWVDQSSFNYNYWNTQQSVSHYQCIYLNARAGWSNTYCSNGWPSICMKRTDTC